MKPNSLSIKTDLIFATFNGEVIDRGEYLVVRTPSNQGYHWGNYLAFGEAPKRGDEIRWPALFQKEFKDLAGVKHMAMTWDSQLPGDPSGLIAKGFVYEPNKVLATAQIVQPAKFNSDVTVRPIATDSEWEAVIREQISVNDKYDPAQFEIFKRAQVANYRRMANAGIGAWFGAFLGDRLTADLGVYCSQGVGRFQAVVTHPEFRRQGICGRLVHDAAIFAQKNFGAETLVMVADPDYHAARIYESVGFSAVEENYTVAWWTD